MNDEVWQQLLSLESRDIVSGWFKCIHSRELNCRRTKEINSAAKQAREYFRNASGASYSVRPLLAFYGVASLSRSLLLLLKRSGGEESLKGSHGLETVDWNTILSTDVAQGIRDLRELRIRTTSGLFSEFLAQTGNRICIHINSSSVEWELPYTVPEPGVTISFGDLLSRLPDLRKEVPGEAGGGLYARVQNLTYDKGNGVAIEVGHQPFQVFANDYLAEGFKYEAKDPYGSLTSDAANFGEHLPQFIHAYVHKTFGTIPDLYLCQPFSKDVRFSQLAITYMLSYILGMLVRYFPTHWMALIQGDKGDALWPAINRIQQLVENSFPELVVELIQHTLKKAGEDQVEQK